MPENLFDKKSVAEEKADQIIMDIDDDSGEVDAESLKKATPQIKKTGNFFVDTYNTIESKILSMTTVPLKERVSFYQMLSVTINAGLPLTKALKIIADQTDNKRFQKVIEALATSIEKGESLSDAMLDHTDVFDEAQIGMVKAGEASGQLNTTLKSISTQMEKSANIKAKLKGAMIYPIIIFTIMAIAVGVVMVMVIPKISGIFLDSGKALPLPTQVLITISDTMLNYWQQGLIAILLFVLGLGMYKKSESGRLVWDKFLLKIPIFGPLRQKVILAQFTRNLGSMLQSGIEIIKSLKIIAQSVGNAVYEQRITLMSEDIQRGIKMADSLGDSTDLFPSLVTSMITVGEQTAQLDTVCEKVANYYEGEVDQYVANLMKMLEPIIMAVIGVVVGGIVAAIMLPILSLSDFA